MSLPAQFPAMNLPCICSRVRRTARRVSQIYDRHLEPYGLTISQFGVLAQIRIGGSPSIGELAERIVMDPTTLTRSVRPLRQRGLVVLTPDARDRRTRRLALTEAGLVAFQVALPGWAAAQHEVSRALGEDASKMLVLRLDEALVRLSPP
ncbi:MAG: MarR family winged helix-turn-helix transcriptional regulator [Phreatobacter sp.]|uniref:MarR family winged helix-turn-helix transcriptional regulator n=1 Tax=Phreatobacter sp. TaxID=1966341 RepID=UPI0027357EFB|nr:MarR family winged helix-turn-helix transcriptional regulator [Phreatobacter sp.]MDP2802337.1 MarR family winged helix-turn-helix transcriptional regulator [Phreatobacter sp.]